MLERKPDEKEDALDLLVKISRRLPQMGLHDPAGIVTEARTTKEEVTPMQTPEAAQQLSEKPPRSDWKEAKCKAMENPTIQPRRIFGFRVF